MKPSQYWLLVFITAFLILLLAFHTVAAPNASINPASWNEANSLSTANVIYRPNLQVVNPTPVVPQTFHSIRATTTISEDALRGFLEQKGSPLAPFSRELLDSPYWSTLVAITAAEQSFYKQPSSSPFNLWGRMYPRCCILKKYPDFPTAIRDMDAYFRDYWEARGYTTIESLNGKYVYPASANWLRTVLTVKQQLESLAY